MSLPDLTPSQIDTPQYQSDIDKYLAIHVAQFRKFDHIDLELRDSETNQIFLLPDRHWEGIGSMSLTLTHSFTCHNQVFKRSILGQFTRQIENMGWVQESILIASGCLFTPM